MKKMKSTRSLPPLIVATMTNSEAELRSRLDAGADVNELDPMRRSALHQAVINGNLSLVQLLLGARADVTIADKNGWTPLHFAAGEHWTDVAEGLIDAGAAVDATDNQGNTPLFRAVFESRGRGEMILLLLGHGADKNRKNKHGVSPADLARTIANFEVGRWLT